MSTNEPPVGSTPPPSPGEPVPPAGGAVPPPPPPSPPPPSYGDAAPPPPPSYGSAPPAPASGWNIGDALSYGWAKFQANAAQFVIGGLALFVALLVVTGVYVVLQNALIDYSSGLFITLFVGALGGALYFVVAQVIGSGLIRGALGVTEGRPFVASEVLKPTNLGPIVITSLIIGAASFVGFLLCYLPGLVVVFMTQWSLYFVIDKGLAPMDAIKASIDLVKNNLTDTLVWYIVGGLVASVGAIACGVGLLVTIPIALVGGAYTFKKLTGQQVVA